MRRDREWGQERTWYVANRSRLHPLWSLSTDYLGSTSGQTDASGNPGALSTDQTFTGQKSDSTGLLYMNARYYDPAQGTFLSPDTIVPDAGAVIDYNRFL